MSFTSSQYFEVDSERHYVFTKEEEEELKSLEKEELQLIEQIKKLEEQRDELEQQKLDFQKEKEHFSKEQSLIWQEWNQLNLEYQNIQNDYDSVLNQKAETTKHLEQLKKSNVYNDAFHIWHNGSFGTINGCRLGRLPDQPVEWAEINAGWGHVVLLLELLRLKMKMEFPNYKLIPMGSFSRIEKTGDDKASFELHGSGEIHLSRLFWNRRLDQGMVAFLQCIQYMSDQLALQDPTFQLPYKINKDKIGDVSIKMQFQQDEVWTKAQKFMLTDLKWLLAFCCKE